jgi:hypothetical protein
MLWLAVVHLLLALADHTRENVGSGYLWADEAKHAALPNRHQQYPCTHNSELLQVSSMYYTIRILLCPLVLVVNIDGGSTEVCLICKEHWWNKEMLSTSLKKRWQKFTHTWKSAITRKLNVSRHSLMWTFLIFWYVELVPKVRTHLSVTPCVVTVIYMHSSHSIYSVKIIFFCSASLLNSLRFLKINISEILENF